MVDTYDPALTSARDRLRHGLFDMGQPLTPPVGFQIQNALDPDVTYDAYITTYGEDEAKWRMAAGFLARYGSDVDRVRTDDGTDVQWNTRVRAWEGIVATWSEYSNALVRGLQKPLVGNITTVAPIASPFRCPDANAARYRGDAYDSWINR